jgi:hypothetical protein
MKTPLTFLRLTYAAGLLLAGAAGVHAQSILPEHFGRWTVADHCFGFTGKPVEGRPDTPLSKEAGFNSFGYDYFCNGNVGLIVRLYGFADPTGAYEFYTSELKVGMNATTIGGASAVDSTVLLTLLGNYVIEIYPPRNISDADLKLLLKPIAAKAMEAPLPPVRGYLPDEALVQGTQRYAMGPAAFAAALESLGLGKFAALTDAAGFKSGAEAMLASYAVRGGKSQTLVLLDYPTPQLAEQQMHHIQPLLAGNAELSGATVERKGSLLALVLSPVSERAAAQLRDEIKYGTEVTWNEPSQTLTDPPWVTVLKNIFLGTFAFCGLAIVLGLAFGGLRVITKRLWPGKVFDRPEDMEVLQLGINSKRIDPRDFY